MATHKYMRAHTRTHTHELSLSLTHTLTHTHIVITAVKVPCQKTTYLLAVIVSSTILNLPVFLEC